ncbi:HAMP domain-containing protein [Rathayibacter sp. VKM Ac-2835]|uniref:sensor histidine kinase n=1 Tax=Rathayibacter sp. VKM Ac-2835 TaxID=2739043 RepID=UPI0015631B97|nr:HAMP domain-containing sensor histidine kinase [Rathayibacter sp. VKM Ac-2835]NRG41083.1 HAMP domain-containing protein [Rathayibacter sp. VKM Ac-2835]
MVVTVVALVAVTAGIVAAVSLLSLRSILYSSTDVQLSESLQRLQDFDGPGRFEGPDAIERATTCSGGSFGDGPSQDLSTITAVQQSDGSFVGAYTDAADTCQQLSDSADSVLGSAVAADGDEVSIDLPGELGQYRVRAAVVEGAVVVVGVPLRGVAATLGSLTVVVVIVVLAAMLLAALLATAIIKVALRPFERVEAIATRVAELPLERGEVELAERVPEEDADTRTEVGRVGVAFNRMLDHVTGALEARQESENKVRQFVADASHELRTPLAAIRGYAELPRRSEAKLSEEAAYSLDRIESAAMRMTSLVEDLLLLARLDEGRALQKEPVDLTMLLIEAVSDAHVAGPDHEWDLELPEEPLEIPGDRFRLHQVVANLLRNATVHTPPGTRVVTTLAQDRDERGQRIAVVSVTDSGPGIDPALVPVLFERFSRGDSSRARTTGSTGLGLAIVAAVVEAHGGRITVASEQHRTTFRVELPAECRA